MSVYDKLASELRSIVTESDSKKPKPYDTDATVVRVEGDTLWVYIPGGVEETPIKKTINAVPGDSVKVHVANGAAWITGNESAPPTDDREALVAKSIAIDADSKSREAIADAERARVAADSAEESAGKAKAQADAASAQALQASTSANSAKSSADDAAANAQSAQLSADNANASASSATYHLTEVEKVIDVLTWISEHGEYERTNDTVIRDGKWYFTLNADGSYSVGNPVENPHDEGFYELASVDNAVSNYVTTHLYLVDGDGLYVRMDEDQGAQLKITGTGIYLINPQGDTIAEYSNNVILGDPEGSHIELSPNYGLGFFQTAKQEDQSGRPINRVAYVDSDRLFIQSATLTNNLQIGNFRWVVLDHRISLKYNPVQ